MEDQNTHSYLQHVEGIFAQVTEAIYERMRNAVD